jgi:RND family efflux transporter MFP subunit
MAALLLAGCSSGSGEEKAADPVALVKLAPATVDALSERLTVYGAADAGSSAERDLAAPVEAILATIDAPVGTRVAAGQSVAHLRPSPNARLELAKALSDAASADAAYARARRLRADGLVGNSEVETARATAAAADATRASLAQRSGGLELRSPVEGSVSSIAVAPGDVLAAGTVVAKVIAVGKGRARFGIDSAMARRIPVGAVVQVMPSSARAGFAAPVSAVDFAVDPQTRLASIYAVLPPEARIGAGEPLKGQIDVGRTASALTVPYAALLDEGGQPYVFVVAGSMAHRRDVAIGPESGNRIAILRGLRSGELVVTEGGTALEDGMKVRPW